jgi:hypothetical protein
LDASNAYPPNDSVPVNGEAIPSNRAAIRPSGQPTENYVPLNPNANSNLAQGGANAMAYFGTTFSCATLTIEHR